MGTKFSLLHNLLEFLSLCRRINKYFLDTLSYFGDTVWQKTNLFQLLHYDKNLIRMHWTFLIEITVLNPHKYIN